MFGKRNLKSKQQHIVAAELATQHLIDTLKAVTFELENGGELPLELDIRIQGLDAVFNETTAASVKG